jgi:hypothetical protein
MSLLLARLEWRRLVVRPLAWEMLAAVLGVLA